MKRFLRITLFVLVTVLLGVGFVSCGEEEASPLWVDYDEARLSEYLSPVTYEGLTVTRLEKETKGDAIWRAVLAGATVKEYPAEQTAYYAAGIRAEYRFLAEREELGYEDLLALRGITEEDILAKAREMVKSDLVLLYVTEDADISLSEAEKEAHYDRYADKHAERYGYDRAYVDANLREEVFDSMLFDKTMEYLILRNEVTNG